MSNYLGIGSCTSPGEKQNVYMLNQYANEESGKILKSRLQRRTKISVKYLS